MTHVHSYADLLEWLEARRRQDRRTLLVAVDGHGGSGKSTFADGLARASGDAVHTDDNAHVVHTDDFAYAGLTSGLDVDRLRRQIVEPLTRDESARHQRFDWQSQQLAEWHEIAPGGLVVVEGVSSLRRELGRPWDLSVWVEAPRSVCLRRGLERDGQDAEPLWRQWLAAEDAYVDRDDPRGVADLIVDGAPELDHDPDVEFVVIDDRRHALG
jgi:uridine kinase